MIFIGKQLQTKGRLYKQTAFFIYIWLKLRRMTRNRKSFLHSDYE